MGKGLCNIPTHTSWMSSAPDATRSQLFSVMHKLLFCALVAPQSFVSPLVAGQGSQKDVPLGRSNTKEYLRPPTFARWDRYTFYTENATTQLLCLGFLLAKNILYTLFAMLIPIKVIVT